MKHTKRLLRLVHCVLVAAFIISAVSYLPASADPLISMIVINEIDYDQPGTDTAEFIELKNASVTSINLDLYSIEMINGASGGAALYRTIDLPSYDLAAGDYYVICGNSANVMNCDLDVLPDSDLVQNGAPDAAALLHNGTLIDTVSYEGSTTAPYTEGSGDGLVDDSTIVGMGIARCADGTDSDQNNIDFGYLAITPGEKNACGTPQVIINELDADTPSVDSAEFLELYDGGFGSASLDGTVLVFYSGSDDSVYRALDLDGYATDANGYFVLCGNSANVANCDLDATPDSDLIQNGADAVGLYSGNAADYPNGTPLSTANLIDAIVYDTADPDDAGLLVLLNPAEPQVDEDAKGQKDSQSSQRCPNGSGGARNTSSYDQFPPTPGVENTCSENSCGAPATLIHMIQGSAAASPLVGQTHTIEGIVTGDYQDLTSGLKGFFVQEEDSAADTDPLTSEGIFVYDNGFGINVAAGDLVRVSGLVTEFSDLTELSNLTQVLVCSSGGSVAATTVNLPVASLGDWETYEGMLVTFLQKLVVTDNYELGRYGEVELSVNDRLWQPTSIAAPGAAALAQQELNNRSRIQLDDGSNVQNPLPLPPYLRAQNTLRLGDSITGLTGVLSFSYGSYEIHPTQAVTFSPDNWRTAPAPISPAIIKVVGMNVLNYFTTLDTGAAICGPAANLDCRGANTSSEFTRQRDKLISAMLAMDADVLGLTEIENNATTAIQDLVDGLNASAGAGTYAYINTGTIGADAIKVALIYQPARLTPIGSYAILDSSVDPDFIDTKNRPSLAQTFEASVGERFTVVVNHFKSKGSACDDVGDPDAGDGQGDCNLTRTKAATALANWLTTDPTGSGDPDYLIIGDLNAYAMEDPITALKNAGYANLIDLYGGSHAYSYTFEGQSGYLDYALASTAMQTQVTSVSEWHANADEPSALDYNNYNQPGLYNPDPYRSADHDPVMVWIQAGMKVFLPMVRR